MNMNTTRLAGLGLGVVLVLLAAFAVGSTLVTNQAVRKATHETRLSAAYERAYAAVSEEESLERKYRLGPSPEIRVNYRSAVAHLTAAMHEIARTGGTRDRELASLVLLEHRPYLLAVERLFDAVDRVDLPTVLTIDRNEVDPSSGAIQAWVRDAAARNRQASTNALLRSEHVSRQVGLLVPAVFAAGLALLVLLWRLRRREQIAVSTKLARHNELLSEQAERLQHTLEERKRAESELAETQERLRHAQKLESVGQLAGGVAHDFNNLLQIIVGYCGMLETKMSENIREEVEGISTAAGRGADLTRQLLAFGRQQTMKIAVWDVNGIVASTESMLKRILPSQIDFIALPSKLELRARVDGGQLEQVLVNLVLNARDAMPDGGTLTVFTEPLELDQPLVVEGVELPQGSYVRIAVRDNGCGMDEQTTARAFEPFFTTKERDRGTGLGLASVYGIVRQSGGFVSLDSTPGVGTEVAVCIPRTLEPVAPSPVADAPAPSEAHGSEQVLLVEDDAAVRSVLAHYLRRQGYRVLEAGDGLEGLELFRVNRGQVDVVVTDIVMPELDGWGLVAELRRVGETVPIVVMSGFAGDARGADGELLEHLMKPFELAELGRVIAPLARDGARPQ